MIRLEKINFSEVSWFAKQGDNSHTILSNQHKCKSNVCTECHEYSKSLYEVGWTCLNPECPKHFHFAFDSTREGQNMPMLSGEICYSTVFLGERTDTRNTNIIKHHPEIVPALPTLEDDANYGTEQVYKRGVVCPRCHCASRRILWTEWRCENENCDFNYKLDFRIYPLSQVEEESQKAKGRKTLGWDEKVVKQWATSLAGYEVQCFDLPDPSGKVCGSVVVFHATKEICSKPNGPDSLYLAMQDPNINLKLERKAARLSGKDVNHNAVGDLLIETQVAAWKSSAPILQVIGFVHIITDKTCQLLLMYFREHLTSSASSLGLQDSTKLPGRSSVGFRS